MNENDEVLDTCFHGRDKGRNEQDDPSSLLPLVEELGDHDFFPEASLRTHWGGSQKWE